MNVLICTNLCYAVQKNSSPIFCYNWKKVVSSIESRSKDFDFVFICNDHHNPNDEEFKILPPHCIEYTPDIYPLEMHFLSRRISYIKKGELNCFENLHLVKLLENLNIKDISIAGFVGCFDVLYTIKNGHTKYNITIYKDCIGDLNEATLTNTIEEIKKLGIKVL